jgi:hypothetical protein
VDGGPAGGPLTVGDIRTRIAQAHQIPAFAINLFADPQHNQEYRDDAQVIYQPPQMDGVKIYWAFLGDAPENWISKRHEVTMAVDNLLLQITEQLNTSTFALEREYFENFPPPLNSEAYGNQWATVNALPLAEMRPTLPINYYGNNQLNMTTEELEYAALQQNLQWRVTSDNILDRIVRLRTDRVQYRENLKSLRENDTALTAQITQIFGQILPPFPDMSLLSSMLYIQDYNADPSRSDLTFRALTSAIQQNTIYYHQELGKFNQLKKEECNLIDKYRQIQTRMKLWIIRERIRLVAWELMYADPNPYADDEWKRADYKTHNPPPYSEKLECELKAYQCIDFCHCEAELSSIIRTQLKKI